ncbi:MAG: LD-carboxypeptidase [Bacteroidales bacterium]|nr:LD-carboxypeptidase [Bacteroidales bacterium]
MAKVIPPYLQKGDEVAFVSPSFAIVRQQIEDAANYLEEWGLKVRFGKYVFEKEGPFAGNDLQRLDDIQSMVDDKNIKAILFTRGGYGALRLIDKIDFSSLIEYPKWFVGFSDITVFHLWINELYGIQTIHGEMPLNYTNTNKLPICMNSLQDTLFGKAKGIQWKGNTIRPDNVCGEIVGGNLSLIYSLIGSLADIDTDGKILFIEDVGEQYYHVDRMLTSLKLAGKLSNLKALLVGGFTKMSDTTSPWNKTIEDIVKEKTEEYDYPVFFDFPAGHQNDNRAFYLGREVSLSAGDKSVLKYR